MGNIIQILRRLPECLLGRKEEEEEHIDEVAAAEMVVLNKDNIGEALSCNIPGDLMLDILSRLPVKSLTRFKCVSKNWKLCVISPMFIEFYYARSRTETKLLIQIDSSLYLCSRDNINNNNISINRVCLPFSPPYNNMFVAGSSNGLVCIQFHSFFKPTIIILWNPATRDYKLLPPPPPLPPNFSGPGNAGSSNFTFISTTNSYKLVFTVYHRYQAFCIDIFTLNNDHTSYKNSSCWRRRIIEPGFPFRNLYSGNCVMANESLNWFANMNNHRGRIIVSFDMNKEYFYYLMTPHGSNYFIIKKLAATGDSQLAMFEYPSTYSLTTEYIRIWRFKLDHHSSNNQGSGNWTRHLTIRIPSSVNDIEVKPPQVLGLWYRFLRLLTPVRIGQPTGFWLNGDEEETIFCDNMDVFLYKPRSQSFYKLPSFAESSILGNSTYQIFSHVDSLLLLN